MYLTGDGDDDDNDDRMILRSEVRYSEFNICGSEHHAL